MAKYDGATIQVINWEKYNPRTDSKKPSWFRFENDLAIGAAFFGLDCEQKWLWVFILSLVSKANGDPITWNAAYCTQLTGIKPKKQDETIEIFERFVRLRVSRQVTQSSTDETNPLRDETNETRRTNETNTLVDSDSGHHVLVDLWNQNSGKLAKVREVSEERKKKIRARWEEHPEADYWTEVIQKLAASPFCQGKNKTGWRADFDFLLQPGTAIKAREGRYDDRKGMATTHERADDLDSQIQELTRGAS